MLIILSPAKTLDFDTASPTVKSTKPPMLTKAEELIRVMQGKDVEEIRQLMKVSEKIAALNIERYRDWSIENNKSQGKQAIYAFMGDVYAGLDAASFSSEDIKFAQTHLRILSGLYGVLRPLDKMQAYRLEMGTRITTEKGNSLYEFWDKQVTLMLNKHAKISGATYLLNLASAEYFKVIKTQELNLDLVTPIFKDKKNGKYKIISFYAKKARGMMARFAIKNRITNPADLTEFNEQGYFFDSTNSDLHAPVFLREDQS